MSPFKVTHIKGRVLSHSFFRSVKRDGIDFVWEPRGDWPADRVRELCRDLDLVHCAYGRFAYYRLHGIGGYRHRYGDEDLRALLKRCREALEAGRSPVYVLFNNMSMLEAA